MRIGYISFEYPPDSSNGGIATYIAQASQMMARRGHEVEVFASSTFRQGRFSRGGVLDHWIKEANRQDFGIVAGHAFASRNAEKPFDVLEGPEFNADARKAVELVPPIPLVLKMHTPSLLIGTLNGEVGFGPHVLNVYRQFRGLAGSLMKGRPFSDFSFSLPSVQIGRQLELIESAHARQAVLIAPPCLDLCQYAKSIWGIPEDKIRLAPHPYIPSKDFLKLQPRSKGFTIGFVGRLEKRKGIETLAEAIPSVLEAVPEAKFRFIGAAGHHASKIKYDEWILKRMPMLADKLEFTGKYPLERMAEAYDSLDICTFPSLWENFPNVCLEAMSAARAVVASSAGGMKEILDHGRVGRLHPPGDSRALAREIISLLTAPFERICLGELARRRVLEAYNESVIGELMERIYIDAINRKACRKNNCARTAKLVANIALC